MSSIKKLKANKYRNLKYSVITKNNIDTVSGKIMLNEDSSDTLVDTQEIDIAESTSTSFTHSATQMNRYHHTAIDEWHTLAKSVVGVRMVTTTKRFNLSTPIVSGEYAKVTLEGKTYYVNRGEAPWGDVEGHTGSAASASNFIMNYGNRHDSSWSENSNYVDYDTGRVNMFAWVKVAKTISDPTNYSIHSDDNQYKNEKPSSSDVLTNWIGGSGVAVISPNYWVCCGNHSKKAGLDGYQAQWYYNSSVVTSPVTYSPVATSRRIDVMDQASLPWPVLHEGIAYTEAYEYMSVSVTRIDDYTFDVTVTYPEKYVYLATSRYAKTHIFSILEFCNLDSFGFEDFVTKITIELYGTVLDEREESFSKQCDVKITHDYYDIHEYITTTVKDGVGDNVYNVRNNELVTKKVVAMRAPIGYVGRKWTGKFNNATSYVESTTPNTKSIVCTYNLGERPGASGIMNGKLYNRKITLPRRGIGIRSRYSFEHNDGAWTCAYVSLEHPDLPNGVTLSITTYNTNFVEVSLTASNEAVIDFPYTVTFDISYQLWTLVTGSDILDALHDPVIECQEAQIWDNITLYEYSLIGFLKVNGSWYAEIKCVVSNNWSMGYGAPDLYISYKDQYLKNFTIAEGGWVDWITTLLVVSYGKGRSIVSLDVEADHAIQEEYKLNDYFMIGMLNNNWISHGDDVPYFQLKNIRKKFKGKQFVYTLDFIETAFARTLDAFKRFLFPIDTACKVRALQDTTINALTLRYVETAIGILMKSYASAEMIAYILRLIEDMRLRIKLRFYLISEICSYLMRPMVPRNTNFTIRDLTTTEALSGTARYEEYVQGVSVKFNLLSEALSAVGKFVETINTDVALKMNLVSEALSAVGQFAEALYGVSLLFNCDAEGFAGEAKYTEDELGVSINTDCEPEALSAEVKSEELPLTFKLRSMSVAEAMSGIFKNVESLVYSTIKATYGIETFNGIVYDVENEATSSIDSTSELELTPLDEAKIEVDNAFSVLSKYLFDLDIWVVIPITMPDVVAAGKLKLKDLLEISFQYIYNIIIEGRGKVEGQTSFELQNNEARLILVNGREKLRLASTVIAKLIVPIDVYIETLEPYTLEELDGYTLGYLEKYGIQDED